MPINIDIIIKSPKWSEHSKFLHDTITQRINLIFQEFVQIIDKEVELSVVAADDKILKKLNKQYRNIDRATNVLAFPTHNNLLNQIPNNINLHLGDIIFSYETILKESQEQEKTILDHTTHLIFHSFLHLLGFTHAEEKERIKMEKIEINFLNKIKIKNPYI